MLGWSDLERTHHSLNAGPVAPGVKIRALGYMMEGERPIRDDDRVGQFILLPEPGSLLHPAHRFGDEMIDVHLTRDNEIQFATGRLVWVWGTLRALAGKPSGPDALYVLEGARALPAETRDISQFFR